MKFFDSLEQKSVQYADDTNVCVSNLISLHDLFKVFAKFEKATNAKINKDKTNALWVGKWKSRND